MSWQTLSDEVIARLDLHLTSKTINDSLIHGHPFYEVGKESGIYLTNHGRLADFDDPHHLTDRNLWRMFSTLGKHKWSCTLSGEMLEQIEPAAFNKVVETLEAKGRL